MKKKIPVKVFLTASLWLNPVPLTLGAVPGGQDASAQELLLKIKELEPAQLYKAVPREEILLSGKENREPRYLETIHKGYGLRLGEFVGELPVGESQEDRIRHGMNLINLMHATNNAAWFAAGSGTWFAASQSARNAPWTAASQSALQAGNHAFWTAASHSARNAAWTTAWTAVWTPAGHAASAAAKEVLGTTQGLSPQEIGRLAYRAAEVTALLYVLKFALNGPSNESQGLFSTIYQASNKILTGDDLPQDPPIWASQEAWDAFFAQYFSNLTAESLAFLTPYLDEIKKLSPNPQA